MTGISKSTSTKIIKVFAINGKEPMTSWLDKIKDKLARAAILRRIDRVALGNYGDHRYLSGELFELRIAIGPGYRVYCGEEYGKVIILLCGGDKSTQTSDIKKAKIYWGNYKDSKNE